MSVKPYQTRPGYLYIPCKRGDGILAPNKPKQLRLFDGMCGGYIDPEDWQTPPVLSEYTQGETLWIETKNTKAAKQWAAAAGQPQNAPTQGQALPANYRRMTNWIDFKTLEPFVKSQCPDFLKKVYEHKDPISVIKLDHIDASCIKNAQVIDPNRTLIADVGQITAGNYTIGPAAGDNYPTFGGAGGGYAALGNLTGNLTFTLTGNITETATAQITEALGGFTLLNTSNNPHYGDPTAGWLITVNIAAPATILFDLQQEGGGIFEIQHLHVIGGNTYYCIYTQAIQQTHTINLHDILMDGNGGAGGRGITTFAGTDAVARIWNCVAWEFANWGFATNAPDTTRIENCASYNNTQDGYTASTVAMILNNCTAYGNDREDFRQIGASTGNNNVSSDATAANGNWAAGANNTINAVVANDVLGVNDAVANFFDINPAGPLANTGIANTIAARTRCIRNRPVPNYLGGTSRGPAEIPWPEEGGLSTLGMGQSHIVNHAMMSIGVH